MDIDDYFIRDRISDRSITVIVREDDISRVERSIHKICRLLHESKARTDANHKILFVIPNGLNVLIPARIGTTDIRFYYCDDPFSAQAMMQVIESVDTPLLLTVDRNVSMESSDLDRMLGIIDHCDCLIGCRKSWFNPLKLLDWPLKRLLRANSRDTLSSIRLYRTNVLNGIPIQCNGDLLELELFVKLTFTIFLFDDVKLSNYRMDHTQPMVTIAAIKQWREFVKLLFSPEFWPKEKKSRTPVFQYKLETDSKQKLKANRNKTLSSSVTQKHRTLSKMIPLQRCIMQSQRTSLS